MGLCLGKTTTAASPCWLDLPPEIAGEILSRLPTHDDRLSFKAVCCGWHLAARQQGPLLSPAAPCVNLCRGMYQSIVIDDNDTKVRRRGRFAMPTGFRAGATFGDSVLYEHKRSRRCFLRNPFSPSTTKGMEVPCQYRHIAAGGFTMGTREPRTILLHNRGIFIVKKIMVCSPSLAVALTNYSVLIDASADSASFRPETTAVLWTRDYFYQDIAFHRGKIFAVNSKDHVFSHWLAGEESPTNPTENVLSHGFFEEAPSHSRTKHVIKEPPATAVAAAEIYRHLVTSSDKKNLLMMRWSIRWQTNDNKVDHHTINLQVFVADFDNGQWSEVKDLGGQDLFVGRSGSKALMVEGSPEHYSGHIFRGGNRVFLLGHDWSLARGWAGAAPCRCLDCQKLANGGPSYCMYDMVSGKTSLVSLNGGYSRSMKSSKTQSLRESHTTPTASMYADGQMSEPSAYSTS